MFPGIINRFSLKPSFCIFGKNYTCFSSCSPLIKQDVIRNPNKITVNSTRVYEEKVVSVCKAVVSLS